MKSRKSQVTMYIFLGLLLLILIFFIFYILSFTKADTLAEIPTGDAESIRACLYNTAYDVYNQIGLYGGYQSEQEVYSLDTLDSITDRAERYIEERFPICIQDLDNLNVTLKKAGVQIQYTSEIHVTVSDFGSIVYQDSVKMIDSVTINLPIDFARIYNTADFIYSFKVEYPGYEPSFIGKDTSRLHIEKRAIYRITENLAVGEYVFVLPVR